MVTIWDGYDKNLILSYLRTAWRVARHVCVGLSLRLTYTDISKYAVGASLAPLRRVLTYTLVRSGIYTKLATLRVQSYTDWFCNAPMLAPSQPGTVYGDD